ncbi:ATP-binding protein [Kitasatospora kazusensis]|uniref:ATP-binding protein n=1 Tax=Kitasatospora kazusensis TaxID=407974 RepID=A0ABP5LWZ7_9ACTN
MTSSRDALDDRVHGSSGGTAPAVQRRRLPLAGLPKPVGRARSFTADALRDWSWPDAEDAGLLVTELVANAMMHAGGPLELVLAISPAGLRVEVSDASPDLPEPRLPHTPGLPGGHGLFIVQHTSTRWGAVPHDQGKTLWAEIDRPDAPTG